MFSISQYVSYFNLILKYKHFNTQLFEGCLLRVICRLFTPNIWVQVLVKDNEEWPFQISFHHIVALSGAQLPKARFEPKLGWNTNEREFLLSDCSPHFGCQNDLIWNKL